MNENPSVTGRMESLIRSWEDRSDRRSTFLRCYYLMTQNMLAAIEVGEFHDPDWVRTLLIRFAGYYFDALHAFEHSRQTAPAVWVKVHESTQEEGTQALQHLLLGVNAPINYDLVLTLVDLLAPEWSVLDTAGRQARYEDHLRVNEIIGRTIDVVQDEVIEGLNPEMDLVDKLFGPMDEWVISGLIGRWREEVWAAAIAMVADSDPSGRERRRCDIEDSTLARAQTILLEGSPAGFTRLL